MSSFFLKQVVGDIHFLLPKVGCWRSPAQIARYMCCQIRFYDNFQLGLLESGKGVKKNSSSFLPLTMAKDSIAELIEIAPTTAINMLDGLLLTEPAAWSRDGS